MLADRTKLDTVLNFWTNEVEDSQKFMRNEELDNVIRERFLPLHQEIMAGVYDDLMDDPNSSLAAVIGNLKICRCAASLILVGSIGSVFEEYVSRHTTSFCV